MRCMGEVDMQKKTFGESLTAFLKDCESKKDEWKQWLSEVDEQKKTAKDMSECRVASQFR